MNVNPQQDLVIAATSRSQKLLERIPHLAWLMTDRGMMLAVNQHWCDYAGQCDLADAKFWQRHSCPVVSIGAAPATVGIDRSPRSFEDCLQVDDRDRWEIAWEEAKRWQTPLAIKLQFKGVGDWEWFNLELEPDSDELGTIWIGTATRLGGQSVIPARQSAQFLEALLDFASDGIVACDEAGQLVLFNRMAQEFHGLPPEPVPPEEWARYYDLYDGDGLRTLTKAEIPLFRALQGEIVIDREMSIKPMQGRSRSLVANASAIYNRMTGEKLGAVALMRDVTDYKQAMVKLQHSESKFRAIFDGVFQFIGLVEPDGKLIEVNLTALKFGGIEAEDAIGRLFWDVPAWKFSADTQVRLCASTAQAAQGEFIRYEVELSGAQQQEIPIDFSLTPILNHRGETTLIIVEGRDISQIRQAQTERLRAELYNERLSTAMQLAKAGAWHWDITHQQVHWTPEFEVLFDYEPGSTEQLYSEWLERVHPEDRARAKGRLQETIDLKLPEFRSEYRIIWRDGQIRWIDTIGELHHNEHGDLEWLSGLVYDITDRKRSEEALRRSEEFTRRILESNQDCIKVLDKDGCLLYMNNGGQLLMEIDDSATIVNKSWSELWQGNEAAQIEQALATAQAGNIGKFEGYCPTAKGLPKWWEVIVTPILDADGRVEQILAVSRDITERRQAALALEASEELFRHTFEHTAIGFCHVALNGTLERANQKFCEIVGYTRAELSLLTFQSITDPADLDQDLVLATQLLNGEIREYSLEKRYIHKQGHQVWVNLTAAVVREMDINGHRGAAKYFLATITDITDRKRLELLTRAQTDDLQRLNTSLILAQHQLKERNQELDSFVYMVSHDLKAPLRSIANLSEWIEEDLRDRVLEDERQQFELLRQRVKRMNALIDGLLNYSRVGSQELECETVDVNRLVAETIDSLAPPPSFEIVTSSSCVADSSSPLPTLNTKRILLAQVLANLIGNAIKHHHRADGRIEITVQDVGNQYQFSIADDGPGIPNPEDRHRIFEMFQTLKPSASNENTGIGLSLVKKIVEGEGGRIWLDLVGETSPLENRTQGACFCFTWPKSV
jgi:PAS domain S-box-containing protein